VHSHPPQPQAAPGQAGPAGLLQRVLARQAASPAKRGRPRRRAPEKGLSLSLVKLDKGRAAGTGWGGGELGLGGLATTDQTHPISQEAKGLLELVTMDQTHPTGP
jgi:hypothetical protein